ncbi:type II secretion system protein GspD [Verrucomicrobiota bacterium]
MMKNKRISLFITAMLILVFIGPLIVSAQEEEVPTISVEVENIEAGDEAVEAETDDSIVTEELSVSMPSNSLPETPPLPSEPTEQEGDGEYIGLPAVAETPEGAKIISDNKNHISVSLDNVALEDVVRLFTRMTEANIIASATNLSGFVTVNLVDVEWRPALSSILEMHNLSLIEKPAGSGVYSIIPRSADAPDPMVVDTMFLKYAQVDNVLPVIQAMLISGASVSPFSSRNALVVKSTENNLGEIKSIIENIDKLRDQVFIEAKFMELNDEAIKDLGINWLSLENYKIGASGLKSVYTETRRETITDEYGTLGGASRGWTRGRDLENNSPVTGTDLGTEGYSESVYDVKSSGKNMTDLTVDSSGNISWEGIIPFESEEIRTAILSMDDFSILLSALKQQDGISIVSNPKIIVANEVPATIHIGQTERPFVSSVTPGQQGIAPVVTYNPGDAVDFGVKLIVTPTVNTESNITVKIEPELTRFMKNAVAPNGQTYPIIATKKITTTFCLENNKTAAIGGLTESEDRDITRKIPFLGDIPFIGKYLFSHTHKEKRQKETIIFVTVGMAQPGTVTDQTGLPADSKLVPNRLLKDELDKHQYEKDFDKLKKDTDKKLSK